MFALQIPWGLLIVGICFLCLLCHRKVRWSFLCLGMLITLNVLYKVFAINIYTPCCKDQTISILSFNINGSVIHSQQELANLALCITTQNADVVFLAEDFQVISESLDSIMSLHYSYSNYHQATLYGGHYFYSKYPLGAVEHLEIESNRFSYCYHCKLAYEGDSLNLFGMHMASNNYRGNEASIRPDDINGFQVFGKYLENIEVASLQRCEEAYKVRDIYIENSGPTIIMGDFNDVSGSKPLKILEEAGFKDAWWEGGFGYGATIHHPLPYRIDHIMYNEGVELIDIQRVDSRELSDHDALVARFKVKQKSHGK